MEGVEIERRRSFLWSLSFFFCATIVERPPQAAATTLPPTCTGLCAIAHTPQNSPGTLQRRSQNAELKAGTQLQSDAPAAAPLLIPLGYQLQAAAAGGRADAAANVTY